VVEKIKWCGDCLSVVRASMNRAWTRVVNLLDTREQIAKVLLDHVRHIHSTLPRPASALIKLLPWGVRLHARAGSGRLLIITPCKTRYEVRLDKSAHLKKIHHILSEYVWSTREFAVCVKSSVEPPPASWIDDIKSKIVKILCMPQPPNWQSLDVLESAANETFLYTLESPNNVTEFCIGHESIALGEECEQSGDDSGDEEVDDEDPADGVTFNSKEFARLAAALGLHKVAEAPAVPVPTTNNGGGAAPPPLNLHTKAAEQPQPPPWIVRNVTAPPPPAKSAPPPPPPTTTTSVPPWQVPTTTAPWGAHKGIAAAPDSLATAPLQAQASCSLSKVQPQAQRCWPPPPPNVPQLQTRLQTAMRRPTM
jgi:hypothetical protein